jgi:predicted MFS family arabinose efflux permease
MKGLRGRVLAIYREYPRAFWTLAAITFIDHIGGFLLFPFFALYLTNKFQVGMAEVGVLFATFSVSSFISQTVGGGLADRFGRKGVIIFGLLASAFSAVAMGFAESFQMFFVLAVFVGLLSDVGGPARQAMVADLLPEAKRADGYGIIRVAFNLSAAIGPALGGLLASRSYLALFLADAAIAVVSSFLIRFLLPETKPERKPGEEHPSLGQTYAGYGNVFKNRLFMLYLGAVFLSVLTYLNMNTTLGVYMRDAHGLSERYYGLLLSINAAMVVVMQFPITRRIEKYPPMLMMALHALLYAVGFAMYAFVGGYGLMIVAMAIITIGEMIGAPVSQAIVANFAPEHMRGRYMAVAGYSWGIAYAIGPYLAGRIMDGPRPHMLWYAAGLLGLLSALGFVILQRRHAGAQALQAEPAVPEIS